MALRQRLPELGCPLITGYRRIPCEDTVMMPNVMITCPNTGKLVPTGFAMDPSAMKTATLEGNEFTCPACGKDHEWKMADAVSEPS